MTQDKDLKRAVRARAAKTGESYAAARRVLAAEVDAPTAVAPKASGAVSVQAAKTVVMAYPYTITGQLRSLFVGDSVGVIAPGGPLGVERVVIRHDGRMSVFHTDRSVTYDTAFKSRPGESTAWLNALQSAFPMRDAVAGLLNSTTVEGSDGWAMTITHSWTTAPRSLSDLTGADWMSANTQARLGEVMATSRAVIVIADEDAFSAALVVTGALAAQWPAEPFTLVAGGGKLLPTVPGSVVVPINSLVILDGEPPSMLADCEQLVCANLAAGASMLLATRLLSNEHVQKSRFVGALKVAESADHYEVVRETIAKHARAGVGIYMEGLQKRDVVFVRVSWPGGEGTPTVTVL